MKTLSQVLEMKAEVIEIIEADRLGESLRMTTVDHLAGPFVSFWIQPVSALGREYANFPAFRIATLEVDPETGAVPDDSLSFRLRAAKYDVSVSFWTRFREMAVLTSHEFDLNLISGERRKEK